MEKEQAKFERKLLRKKTKGMGKAFGHIGKALGTKK